MIKELLEMTNTSQSIVKQNNLKKKKERKKALCHDWVMNWLFLASTIPEPRFFTSFFPCGSDTHFKSALAISLHIVATSSTLQTYKGES